MSTRWKGKGHARAEGESRERGGEEDCWLARTMICCATTPSAPLAPLATPACGCRQVKVNLSSCQVSWKYLSASLSRISTGKSVASRQSETCVCVCDCGGRGNVLYNKLARRKDGRGKISANVKEATNKQIHTHTDRDTRTHSQDVSVSWTHKATLYTYLPPYPLHCPSSVTPMSISWSRCRARSTLWPFIRYVLYLCLPTLMVLMPFVLATPHPEPRTRSPSLPHTARLLPLPRYTSVSTRRTDTHIPSEKGWGVQKVQRMCFINSRGGAGGGEGEAGAGRQRAWQPWLVMPKCRKSAWSSSLSFKLKRNINKAAKALLSWILQIQCLLPSIY